MSRSNILTAHINLNVRINESDYRWNDPNVEEYIDFSIPLELLDSTKLSKMIENKIKELVVAYRVAADEAQQKAEEEAKQKAKEEANAQV